MESGEVPKRSIEETILEHPKNSRVYDDKVLMKFNILPNQERNFLANNKYGYFDIYTKARRNTVIAHKAVKSFMADTLRIDEENVKFLKGIKNNAKIMAIKDDAFKEKVKRSIDEQIG